MLNTYLMDLVQTGRVWLMTHEQSSCNKVLRWGLLMRQNLTGPWAGWSEGRTVGQIRHKNSKDIFLCFFTFLVALASGGPVGLGFGWAF